MRGKKTNILVHELTRLSIQDTLGTFTLVQATLSVLYYDDNVFYLYL